MVYLITAIIVLSVLADQIIKWIVTNTLDIGQTVPLIDGVFHFTYVQNFGAAFSILQNKGIFLIIFTALVIAVMTVILYRYMKNSTKLLRISMALIIGGGIGNLTDRIRTGFVVDFIDVRIFDYPVFNIADCCVVAGGILLIAGVLFTGKKKNGQISDNGGGKGRGNKA